MRVYFDIAWKSPTNQTIYRA